MYLQTTVCMTFVAVAIATTPCLGTKDHIELHVNATNLANPLFHNTDTDQTFHKYSTSVGDATEEEMNALEFTSSYNPDNAGNTWLISEELRPVAQITKAYMDQFAGEFPTDTIGDEHYVFNMTYFNERLEQVRADPEVIQQAQAWVVDNKRLLDPSLAAIRALEERSYVRCGPSRCQSQRTCVAWNGWCNKCERFSCNFWYTGIIDGC
ncbi:hypothetical protein LIA77_11517 [Sarocladium implicatum]|nr:hypothetical protein LIA77_11517 [Sarocladium implicatum]